MQTRSRQDERKRGGGKLSPSVCIGYIERVEGGWHPKMESAVTGRVALRSQASGKHHLASELSKSMDLSRLRPIPLLPPLRA